MNAWKTVVVATISGLFLGHAIASVKEAREFEAEERKRVAKARAEKLACIENYTKNLRALVDDPNVTLEQLWETYAYETEFLNIVTNQD